MLAWFEENGEPKKGCTSHEKNAIWGLPAGTRADPAAVGPASLPYPGRLVKTNFYEKKIAKIGNYFL
jgi:hypothetical protein